MVGVFSYINPYITNVEKLKNPQIDISNFNVSKTIKPILSKFRSKINTKNHCLRTGIHYNAEIEVKPGTSHFLHR